MLGDQPAQVVALEGEGGDDVDGGLGRQCFKTFFFLSSPTKRSNEPERLPLGRLSSLVRLRELARGERQRGAPLRKAPGLLTRLESALDYLASPFVTQKKVL